MLHTRKPALLLLFSLLPVAAIGSRASDYLAIKKKFQTIEKSQAKPGTRISIPARELNAYVQTELPQVAPPGIRNPSVELLGNNTASGRALINFHTLRSARGKSSNWLMRRLLDGEREVVVTTRVASSGGTATVFIERVEVSGVPIEGGTLDFLIDNYLRPNYPDAKIGEPFKIGYRVDRLEVGRDVAHVVLR